MPSASPIRCGYTDGRFGQLHHRIATPAVPTRPPLVLLHQNPSTSEEYRALIQEMAADRIVVAFDTPGYGMSERPPAPLSITGYAEAFIEGIDALGLAAAAPIDVFGFHTGSLLAIETARLLASRARRIAVAGVPLRSPEERRVRLDQIHAVSPPTDDGDKIFERLRWLWDFLVARRAPGVPIERAARMFIERAAPLHLYWWAYEGVWTYPIEERLRAITHETLILLPDEMFRDQGIVAAAMIPRARTIDLPMLTRDIFEPAGGCAILADALRSFLT